MSTEKMGKEKEPKAATEDPKIDLFEDDDEFEEFEIDEGFSLCLFLFVYFYYHVLL